MVRRTIEEINQKIKDGSVHVVTAEEMTALVQELGVKEAAKQVDVVTTGTFGAMCSSGVFFNFGHSDPPIKMQKVWMNDVEAYTGIAAVDAYLGATQLSDTKGMEYGGSHVIEDLLQGKEIWLKATAYGTDCYPRKRIDTSITLDDMNQATMVNPRNAYQKYNSATNCSSKTIYTYMGTLLPNCGNVAYSGAGVLSPLSNDPTYRTIGIGTRIFLGGAQGYVVSEGTQHSPSSGFGTLMVTGDLRKMSREYIRAATFYKYGTTMYVGLGIPIPVLDDDIAKAAAVGDADITTTIYDYSTPRRVKPALRDVTYEELKSGMIDLNGKEVKTSSLSSFYKARQVASELKAWIRKGQFFLSLPAQSIPAQGSAKPMKQTLEMPLIKDVMAPVATINLGFSVQEAAKKIIQDKFNHLPVVDENSRLVGIVTSWDVSKALALAKSDRLAPIMTKNVITVAPDDPADVAVRLLEKHNISALPVIDKDKKVLGIVTGEGLSKLISRGVRP
ncbi:MAG TPA: homocysteine biosynthesis protein [Methanocella sp.]|uniref:homocysteine biosynthesis protein n=1 Tax=Methanocella sp. TaxID=2052833 RepID=UPI002CF8D815|nr:homocysteine biosynthesis protein [Methanocella sp.]HTY91677.1 homocysteine biosynthesis protein [Methanocella sp.]